MCILQSLLLLGNDYIHKLAISFTLDLCFHNNILAETLCGLTQPVVECAVGVNGLLKGSKAA